MEKLTSLPHVVFLLFVVLSLCLSLCVSTCVYLCMLFICLSFLSCSSCCHVPCELRPRVTASMSGETIKKWWRKNATPFPQCSRWVSSLMLHFFPSLHATLASLPRTTQQNGSVNPLRIPPKSLLECLPRLKHIICYAGHQYKACLATAARRKVL